MRHVSFANLVITLAGVQALSITSMHADSFGTGGNAFTIAFANIGNSGNGDDLGAGGGIYSSAYGGVGYAYRMGMTEVPQDWITKATNLGLAGVVAGAWGASQPAANMTWFEAAAFVNWLNTSTGHQAAYQIDAGVTSLTLWAPGDAWDNDPGAGVDLNLYRHKNAYYFLPSEDEWYKSAYHKNDGVTANYWDYATGSNTIPDGIDFNGDTTFDAVFAQGFNQGLPNAVTNVGLASTYGTFGQNGNVFEWNESGWDGMNDSSSENRVIRGSSWNFSEFEMRSSVRTNGTPTIAGNLFGFRVASVPEPSSALLLLGSGLIFLARRRRRPGL